MAYKKYSQRLNGLRLIVKYLCADTNLLAESVGISYCYLLSLCAGNRQCSLTVLHALADSLKVTANDLVGEPSPARLSEIRIAYLAREIEAERQKFLRLKSEQDLADIATAEGEAA